MNLKTNKETYLLPQIEMITADFDSPLAASVGGGQTEDLINENWEI